MINPSYRAQVDLLLQVLPHVAQEKCFALKGGTAINMFIWNMPRLSVDIDLTYLSFDDRATAMANIAAALDRIRQRIEKAIPDCTARLAAQSDGQETKLICQTAKAQIKIEVNTTMRGAVFAPENRDVAEAVEDEFGRFASMNVLSQAELFGGKISAALDRQHPRDLFDVSRLFETGGITREIMLGFIIGLLSGPRPIHEMIRPHFLDQRRAFETQFTGMADAPFSYEDFEATRERLVREIHAGFTDTDRAFLLGFINAQPDWPLFPHETIRDLPAVRWKLSNIENLKAKNPAKHAEQLKALEERLK
ncbi:MAG: nucleotidyl transferase AbiEii/AbiGii toxin family protein [Spartobacteria bacterium]|nr:nucleotidyl transferase AbiEii/AbiGii toxin family protein [Spartobacteria bacterium]